MTNDASQGGAALSAEERAELRALCEAASPAPWRAEVFTFCPDAAVYGPHGEFEAPMVAELHDADPAADAAFIAAARTALPRLLDALAEVERELAYLRKHGCYGAPSIDGGVAVIGRQATDAEVSRVATFARQARTTEQGRPSSEAT